jgi:hypothetical protein
LFGVNNVNDITIVQRMAAFVKSLMDGDKENWNNQAEQDYTGAIKEQLTPGSINSELGNIKRYFDMAAWNYVIVFLIASTGLAAIVNTYDAISGINKKKEECEKLSLKNYTLTKFIIMLIFSIFAIGIGLFLAFFFRKNTNQRRMISLGIITIGVFGVIYSLSLQFQDISKNAVLYTSWVLFILSILLGWFLSTKTNVKIVSE